MRCCKQCIVYFCNLLSSFIIYTLYFSSIRPFCLCTTPLPRRTLTRCCRHCRTTSRTSWRRSRWRLSGWWRTRSLWWETTEEPAGGQMKPERCFWWLALFSCVCCRAPPSGGTMPPGLWSWRGSWEEELQTEAVKQQKKKLFCLCTACRCQAES